MFDTDSLAYTASPREVLDAFVLAHRAAELARVELRRWAAAAYSGAVGPEVEFVGDELGLAMGLSGLSGRAFLADSVAAVALPGLLEQVQLADWTDRHVMVVLHELGQVDEAQRRQQVLERVIAKAAASAERRGGVLVPHELRRLVRQVLLTLDMAAAEQRRRQATERRAARAVGGSDGPAYLMIEGPAEQVAAMDNAIRAHAGQLRSRDAAATSDPAGPDQQRNLDQRCFDAALELLTGSRSNTRIEIQVLVPFSTAAGGDLELAEIPGLGHLLPSTARDLLATADTVRRITVDGTTGQVLTVDDARPGPGRAAQQHIAVQQHAAAQQCEATQPPSPGSTTAKPAPTAPAAPAVLAELLHWLANDPVVPRDLSSSRYRPPGRTLRHLEARDRTCVFPGCHVPGRRCDKDHREPWPHGPTTEQNSACLCRRHHRAKHTSFTLTRAPDGTHTWTTRTGHSYTRPPLTW